MKRVLLGLACAVSLVALSTAVVRADEKPADAGATTPKKTHHKKKKAATATDKAAAGSTTTK